MQKQVSYKKQAALCIMLLLIIFVIGESFVRTYDTIRSPFYSTAMTINTIETDLSYNFILSMLDDYKKIHYTFDNVVILEPNQHTNSYNINKFGFRGNEILMEKMPETYRIFVVGGSTTFGYVTSSDNYTISSSLQTKFNEIGLDNVEVINAGIGAAASIRERYYLENILLNFEPDMIINYGGGNDARYAALGIVQKLSDDKIDLGQYLPFDFRNSRFLEAFSNRLPQLIPTVNSDQNFNTLAIDTWLSNWRYLCDQGKNNDHKTVVLLQPVLGSGNRTLSPIEQKILNDQSLMNLAMMGNKIHLLEEKCDLVSDMRSVTDDWHGSIYYDHVHMTDQGYKKIGNEIFDLIYPMVVKDIESNISK